MKPRINFFSLLLAFSLLLFACSSPTQEEETATITINLGGSPRAAGNVGFGNELFTKGLVPFLVHNITLARGQETFAVSTAPGSLSATARVAPGDWVITVEALVNGWPYADSTPLTYTVTEAGPNKPSITMNQRSDAIVLSIPKGTATITVPPDFETGQMAEIKIDVYNFTNNPSSLTISANINTGPFSALTLTGTSLPQGGSGEITIAPALTSPGPTIPGSNPGHVTFEILDGGTPVLSENFNIAHSAYALTTAGLKEMIDNPDIDYIFLAGNITINEKVDLSKYFVIDGNGHSLSRDTTYTSGPLIDVQSGGTLTLRADTSPFTLDGAGVPVSDSLITVTGGDLHIYSGVTLSNNDFSGGQGGAVSVYSGSLTLSGGTIGGTNNAAYGGGVYVGSGTSFGMGSGDIQNNTAGKGGGVYVANGGSFTMDGGNITGNDVPTNTDGSGVYVESNGSIAGIVYALAVDNNKVGGITTGVPGENIYEEP